MPNNRKKPAGWRRNDPAKSAAKRPRPSRKWIAAIVPIPANSTRTPFVVDRLPSGALLGWQNGGVWSGKSSQVWLEKVWVCGVWRLFFFWGGEELRVMRGFFEVKLELGMFFFFVCVWFFWVVLVEISCLSPPSYHDGSVENDPMKEVPREASHEDNVHDFGEEELSNSYRWQENGSFGKLVGDFRSIHGMFLFRGLMWWSENSSLKISPRTWIRA